MAFSWATVKDGDIILADDINNIAQAIIDTQTDVTTATATATTAQTAAESAVTTATDAAEDAAAAQETADTKADSVADNGGFVAGEGASVGDDGGGSAIGYYASVTYSGGAVGNKASANSGFAGGQQAKSTGNGAAIGANVSTNHGGAVGNGATSTNGFAGGFCALTSDGVAVGTSAQAADADGNAIDAIQLGTGTNSAEKTLQVYDYQLMDADGNIPYDRMQAATDVANEAQTAANNAQTAADNAQKTAESKIEKKVVDELPSTSAGYDFEDQTSRFVNSYRTACSVETDDDNGGYYQKITNSGNSNTYREAVFDCSDIFANATVATVEFDALFSGRWHISLADLSQRPGESTGSTYTDAGCAFSIGSTNGSTVKVYGADGTMTLTGWKTVKAVLDFSEKTAEYTVTDRTEGTVLQTGTIPFRDTSVTAITGFEAYTWSTGDLLIDNIKITALMSVDENAMYLISDGEGGYTAWMYINDEPIQITGGTTETAVEDVTGKAKWLTTEGVDIVNSINNMKRQLAKNIYETAKGALVRGQNSTLFKEVTMSCTLAAGYEVVIEEAGTAGWFGDGDIIPFYIESDNFDSYDRDGDSNYQKYVTAGCIVAYADSSGDITITTKLPDIPSTEFKADTTGEIWDVKYFTATFKWYQSTGTDYPIAVFPNV